MKNNFKKVPEDLIDENEDKFIHWLTNTIKSEFSTEIDLFMEIRKKQRHASSISRLITKKSLISTNEIGNYFNQINNKAMKQDEERYVRNAKVSMYCFLTLVIIAVIGCFIQIIKNI